MKIIRKGTPPSGAKKKFTCNYCMSVFVADKGEWQACDQLEYMHDGLMYKCVCPVCNNMAYIETR